MPRFTLGARVRVSDEKTTDQIGTVIEILQRTPQAGDFDRYRVQFPSGQVDILSDLEIAPAGISPATIEGPE